MNFPTDGTPFSSAYLFRPLSPAEASALDTIAIGQLAVPANRDLVRAGEVGGHMMLLLDGWCFRYRQRSDGRRFILEILLPGDMIGLQAGVLGITDHTVRALTAARTKLIDGRRLDELYRAKPEFALALTRYLAAQQRRLDRRLSVTGSGSAPERIAYLFWEVLQRYDRQHAQGGAAVKCPFPLRRQHIADATGLTGAHVNRVLRRFRTDGPVRLEEGVLTVTDTVLLQELARRAG